MGEDEENFPLDVEVEGFGSYEFEGLGFRVRGSGLGISGFMGVLFMF